VISGHVESFATIIPKRVVLRGYVGKSLKGVVTIIPKKKYPFMIIVAKAKNGNNIRYRIEKIQQANKKGYLLTVENIQNVQGRYFDTISLKTDSRILPEIIIKIFGDIRNKPE
jgi:hypothetical protein